MTADKRQLTKWRLHAHEQNDIYSCKQGQRLDSCTVSIASYSSDSERLVTACFIHWVEWCYPKWSQQASQPACVLKPAVESILTPHADVPFIDVHGW